MTTSGGGSGQVSDSTMCGTVVCVRSIPNGTVVTLTATPYSGSVFAGWGGVCTGTGSCTLNMTSDKNVNAIFNVRPPDSVPDESIGGIYKYNVITHGYDKDTTLVYKSGQTLFLRLVNFERGGSIYLRDSNYKSVLVGEFGIPTGNDYYVQTGGIPKTLAPGPVYIYIWQPSYYPLKETNLSQPIMIEDPSLLTPPSTPTSLTAVENPRGTVKLTWNDTSSNETSFQIGRGYSTGLGLNTANFDKLIAAETSANATTYSSDAPPATALKYALRARALVNGSAFISPISNIVSLTTQDAPTKTTVTAKALSSTSVSLTWKDSNTGITNGYTIVNGTTLPSFKGALSTVPANLILASKVQTKSYTITGLIPKTKYCYYVYAVVNSLNASPPNAQECVTTPGK